MIEDREAASLARIDLARRLNRRLADQLAAKGLSVEEIAIGTVYATFDIAERHAGAETAAIEWLRDATDVLERGLLDGSARRARCDR